MQHCTQLLIQLNTEAHEAVEMATFYLNSLSLLFLRSSFGQFKKTIFPYDWCTLCISSAFFC